jgi:hypothetical protein
VRAQSPNDGEFCRRIVNITTGGKSSDILDAIVAEGQYGTCGTLWDLVVKADGKRPVKIKGDCPNDVCALDDWWGSSANRSSKDVQAGQLWTVILTPELNVLPTA